MSSLNSIDNTLQFFQVAYRVVGSHLLRTCFEGCSLEKKDASLQDVDRPRKLNRRFHQCGSLDSPLR
jgi:hypothetical protein